MMTTSVFKIIHHTPILNDYPRLVEYRDRCFARPAYKKAIEDQCDAFLKHQAEDMKYHLRQPA